jgi:hypothetical protein
MLQFTNGVNDVELSIELAGTAMNVATGHYYDLYGEAYAQQVGAFACSTAAQEAWGQGQGWRAGRRRASAQGVTAAASPAAGRLPARGLPAAWRQPGDEGVRGKQPASRRCRGAGCQSKGCRACARGVAWRAAACQRERDPTAQRCPLPFPAGLWDNRVHEGDAAALHQGKPLLHGRAMVHVRGWPL